MLKATTIDRYFCPDCNGRKEGRKAVEMEGLWTEAESMNQLTIGLQLGRQGEELAKDKKIPGLTLELDVLTLDSWSVRISLCTLAAS
jgi:hypothetical protein